MSVTPLIPPLRAVVFDLDGTLYVQPPLRRRMAMELLLAPLFGPRRALRATRNLRAFRNEREGLRHLGRPTESLEALQFSRPAAKLGVAPDALRATVQDWMFERPLRHLLPCARPGLSEQLARLAAAKLALGVFSDYPVDAKLRALGVRDHFSVAFDATDPEVNAFKPHPRGFELAAERLGVAPREALYVGDRVDVDVGGAHAAGMHAAWLVARPPAVLPEAPAGLALLCYSDLRELVDAILAPRR